MIHHKLTIDLRAAAALTAIAAIALLLGLFAGSAEAAGGGVGPATGKSGVAGKKAKLMPNGKAIAPRSAPERVKKVIAAANRIEDKPYHYGGGHGSFKDKGYDCSGAVSYALHGGGFLKSPMPSGSFMNGWGVKGKGKWITTYANNGHMYAVIAGLRWDTSGGKGSGPSWYRSTRSPNSGYFAARHPAGH